MRSNLAYADVFGLEESTASVLIANEAEIAQVPFAYSHMVKKAWQVLDLNAVVCVNGKPTIYIKEMEDNRPSEMMRLHKIFWNQGLATLLVLVSGNELYFFSGLVKPAKDDTVLDSEARLIQVLSLLQDPNCVKGLLSSVETGQFYSANKASFSSDNGVDKTLLKNLSEARNKLVELDDSKDKSRVHNFLGRLLFVLYLTDRKIIGDEQFTAAGAEDVGSLHDLLNKYSYSESKSILEQLFYKLKDFFNGTMFDGSLADTLSFITTEHLQIIHRFLKGESIGSGQMSLGFWAYDFSVIPVETISGIYEDFLKTENQGEKHDQGAYYTPKLLAEMVIDVATSGVKTLLGKKFLDPACGSGIFLVTVFNRIAEEWKSKNPNADNVSLASALFEILHSQIYGIDINETACRITCFSLYLALLDHLEPRDIVVIQKMKGVVFRNLLWVEGSDSETATNDFGRVICNSNFFSNSLPLPAAFDVIVGNPPWIGRNQESEDDQMYAWCEELRSSKRFGKLRLDDLVPQKQIAHAFLWKSLTHLPAEGTVCLLVTSKVLFNKTSSFQRNWFSVTRTEEIYQLSDLRFMLFENAINPSMIVKAKPQAPDVPNYTVKYITPKATKYDPRKGVVTVMAGDVKCIDSEDVVAAAELKSSPIFWKKMFWGSPRDVALVDKLLRLPKLADLVATTPIPDKRWVACQGFQPFYQESYDRDPTYGEPQPPYWEANDLYLDAKRMPDCIVEETDCVKIGDQFPLCHRRRPHQIYNPPMVLVNKGFTKFAFCDLKRPVYFQDAIYSIAGNEKDRKHLLFLSAYLKSNLAKYFIFHTSSSWGIERPQIHPNEYKRIPYIFPHQSRNPKRAEEILGQMESMWANLNSQIKSNFLAKSQSIKQYQQECNRLIYEYFGLTPDEMDIVNDTIGVYIPAVNPSNYDDIATMVSTTYSDRSEYAKKICSMLNRWASKGGSRAHATTYLSKKSEYAVFHISRDVNEKEYTETISSERLVSILSDIKQKYSSRQGFLSLLFGIKIFDGPNIYIIKDLSKAQWLKSVAINDANEIATDILKFRSSQ